MSASTISRPTITDDDGTGLTGTIFNAAFYSDIFDRLDALFAATTGLVLNQAGGDTAILTLESSDVAHGVTVIAGTSAFGQAMKFSANGGGLQIDGLAESAETVGLFLRGIAGTDNTTHGTAGLAYIVLQPAKINGTTIQAPGANANLVAIRDGGGTTRILFDAEGDSFQDGTGWTAYDDHDDLALVDAIDRALDPRLRAQAVDREAAAFLREQRPFLQAARIVDFNEEADGVPFVNMSRLAMLHNGALRQLFRQLQALEGRVAPLLGAEGLA